MFVWFTRVNTQANGTEETSSAREVECYLQLVSGQLSALQSRNMAIDQLTFE